MKWGEVAAVLDTVRGRWTVTILRHLADGGLRPADLLSRINAELRAAGRRELSRSSMLARLGVLVKRGLIRRAVLDGGAPQETRYWLSFAGREAMEKASLLGGGPVPPPGLGLYAGGNMNDPPVSAVNPDVPTPPRLWHVLSGGKPLFPADREAAALAEQAIPGRAREVAAATRRFQASVVRQLADRGVRQFLDIGTGLPADGDAGEPAGSAVHEVAQRAAPESRVVYVDNDPVVLAHARALLKSSPEGSCAYIEADLRDPGAILAGAQETLDLSRPTAIMLISVLQFVQDTYDPWAITSRLAGGVSGDCYLAVVHAASDLAPHQAAQFAAAYNQLSPVAITMRPREQVARFFTGLQMLEPGLVRLSDWPPVQQVPGAGQHGLHGYAGVGYRPAARP